MSNYKGYLPGVNPNYTKKVLQDDDDRYFAMDSGRFVNGLGVEVKTMAEAVAANDKIDAEYNKAWPPQKAINAKPVRAIKSVPGINSKPKKDAAGYAKPGPFESTLNKIIDYAPNKIARPKQKRITPSNSYQILKKQEAGKDLGQFSNIQQDADERAPDEEARVDAPLVQSPEVTDGDQPGVPKEMKNKEPKTESEFIQRLKTLSGQN